MNDKDNDYDNDGDHFLQRKRSRLFLHIFPFSMVTCMSSVSLSVIFVHPA